ncbi:MAG: enoyl-CoA hydratase/isomerase family protein [Myxococcales bacterium]|nr:enoyl-CoA hydratase/isomerase family protein [Myxococcales bacterium]
MIRTDIHAGVAHLWLARPEKHNAFDGAMLTQMAAALEAFGTDPAVRVVVLAGEGSSFCAGADLGWMLQQAQGGDAANSNSVVQIAKLFHSIAGLAKPVVARVHGAARGGGVGLVAACDVAVASTAASFTLTEVRLGLLPAVISPFLVERVGPSQARALFLLGDKVTAEDAWRIGLVHAIATPADLDARVERTIASLLAGGPEALAACKRLVRDVAFRAPADVVDVTAHALAQRRVSDEAAEGMAAFLEKRPASWIPRGGH